MRPSSSVISVARLSSGQIACAGRAVRNISTSTRRCEQDGSSQSAPSSSTASSSRKPSAPAAPAADSTDAKSSRRSKQAPSSSSLSATQTTKPLRIDAESINSFPSLLYNTSPVLDSGLTLRVPPERGSPFGGSVTLRNSHPRLFPVAPPSSEALAASGAAAGSGERESLEHLSQVTGLTLSEVMNLHRHALVLRRVTRMSGKGKIQRMGAFVVAGNGNGMVGYGEAKDANAGKAARKAFQLAVKSMDFVNRYEGRTVETTLHGHWGSTRIELRPRPPGFGLRVPPAIHAVARSAGMTDLSASIRGSANPASVVKATLQALWPGAHPLGLGDGLGGPARRTDKGQGARTRDDIMRARGRRIVDVHVGPIASPSGVPKLSRRAAP